ncbi:unnamed protein product, partial [Mesorhabditis spiculigera]
MPTISEVKLDFKDVMLRPKRSTLSSRSEVDLNIEYTFKNSKKTYSGIPVISSNMDTTGTFEMADALSKVQLFTTIHKHYTVEQWKEYAAKCDKATFGHIAVSTGISDNDFNKLRTIVNEIPELGFICVDVANGYAQIFVDFIRKVREEFPRHTMMAGNVVTGEMCEELILTGADVVKVGIGPGSVCTTRKKAGVGYPQLSAVLECADAAHGLNGHVISDGGCTNPGDVSKAFGAGADFVMLGGMFAGHDQSGGELIEKDGRYYKMFYGMSSDTAMKKYHGAVAEYRASEGKTVQMPYRGDVMNTVQDILGGIRSACTYTGSKKLKELSKRTTFIRCSATTNEALLDTMTPPPTPSAGSGSGEKTSNTNTGTMSSAVVPRVGSQEVLINGQPKIGFFKRMKYKLKQGGTIFHTVKPADLPNEPRRQSQALEGYREALQLSTDAFLQVLQRDPQFCPAAQSEHKLETPHQEHGHERAHHGLTQIRPAWTGCESIVETLCAVSLDCATHSRAFQRQGREKLAPLRTFFLKELPDELGRLMTEVKNANDELNMMITESKTRPEMLPAVDTAKKKLDETMVRWDEWVRSLAEKKKIHRMAIVELLREAEIYHKAMAESCASAKGLKPTKSRDGGTTTTEATFDERQMMNRPSTAGKITGAFGKLKKFF